MKKIKNERKMKAKNDSTENKEILFNLVKFPKILRKKMNKITFVAQLRGILYISWFF